MKAIPKPRRELDPQYLAFVREHPCCIHIKHECIGPIEAHHVSPRNGTKGVGSKVSDRRTVPVCFDGHRLAETFAVSLLQYFDYIIRRLNIKYAERYPDRKPPEPRKKPRRLVKKATGYATVHNGRILDVHIGNKPKQFSEDELVKVEIRELR